MPDILIRGIEYPKSCADCEWIVQRFPGADYWCKRTNTIIHATWPSAKLNQKPDSCPIHELPPHGDLIDRDEVVNLTDYYEARFAIFRSPKIFVFMQGQAFDVMRRIIKKAVAVVPASEEGG